MKTNQILITPIVTIQKTQEGFEVQVKLRDGGWLRMNPYPETTEGLVCAMQLATECLAGKFYPVAVVDEILKQKALELHNAKQIK